MQGFKSYIESYSDFAYYASEDPSGPSIYDALQDVFDVKKALKGIDFVLGASKMLLMLKPTLRAKLDVLQKIKDLMLDPKDKSKWIAAGKAVGATAKLTAANPLLLFPAITPLVQDLSPTQQAVVLGIIKFLSSTYFYLSSLAEQNIDNEKLQALMDKIKPLLPDIHYGNDNT